MVSPLAVNASPLILLARVINSVRQPFGLVDQRNRGGPVEAILHPCSK